MHEVHAYVHERVCFCECLGWVHAGDQGGQPTTGLQWIVMSVVILGAQGALGGDLS